MESEKSKNTGGIRRRWIVNSISVVVLIVVIAVVSFSVAMAGYYYTSMSTGLENTAKAATGFLEDFTESEYRAYVSHYVSAFEDKDKLELQFLSRYGTIQESTSGLTANLAPGTPDISEAINNQRTEPWTGKDPSTGERIMAVSAPVIYNGTVVGVMRVVTSLRLVDRQIVTTVLLALLVGCVVLAIVYFSNLYFVRSIVTPVAEVTEVTKRIASGSYGIQMEKKNSDEIGDLIDAINDMSLKIKQSEKTQSEFISSVSHELRTPLTAINGWAETIMNGEVRSSADVKKGMGIIVSEARRLTDMVEELLEFSRIEDGRFTLSVEEMDLKAELEDAVYTYREFFRREGTVLNYDDGEEDLPPVTGDPDRMRQVFCNLLDNAFKHGGSGKRIDVGVRREGDRAVITIRDYGPGIPEEELPHVKYKFYKGSSKARGSGIGLAVCDEIITRHNGELEIGNAEGGGCIVTLRLPINMAAGTGT
jgi:signal transduction histidine kinase